MPGTLIDGSTIDVGSAQQLHGAATRSGSRFVGALVAGGTGGATRGATLAGRVGLEHSVSQRVATVSPGDSWCPNTRYPVPGAQRNASVDDDFAATSSRDLALEEVLRAVAAAEQPDTDLEVGRLSTSMHQRLSDAGAGNLHCSAAVTVTDGSIDRKERY